jgi:hypothetical protein
MKRHCLWAEAGSCRSRAQYCYRLYTWTNLGVQWVALHVLEAAHLVRADVPVKTLLATGAAHFHPKKTSW